MKLFKKVAMVTGSSRGIGRAIAVALAKEGADIVLHGQKLGELEKAEQEIRAIGRDVFSVSADVRNSIEVGDAVERAAAHFGKIDILVNNAGIAVRKPFMKMTQPEWDEMIDVNLKGVFVATKAVLKRMKGGGMIINIASGAGLKGHPELAVYSASKFGVVGFSQALAEEVHEQGVSVYAVCPGPVDTRLYHDLGWDGEDELLAPEDVARLVLDIVAGGAKVVPGQSVKIWKEQGNVECR